MNFRKHSNLPGDHSFLSASKHHWLNYDEDKLVSVYEASMAAKRGSELHDFAARCIRLGQKLPRTNQTLNMYVNDAIGFRMTPEQVLYYSPNCYGTADAISFREKDKKLRIHDYKSGESPASMNQLRIYAALFCLEYDFLPEDLEIELRIYQSDDYEGELADPALIKDIMLTIIRFDKILNDIQREQEE